MLTNPPPPNDEEPPETFAYSRGTGRQMSVLALALAGVLAVGFFSVNAQRRYEINQLAATTGAETSKPPSVDVVSAKSSPLTQHLVLPGETAAWYDSKIYARVNGYVEKWLVDIGDHKVAAISIWETREAAEKSALVAASWVKENISDRVRLVTGNVGALALFHGVPVAA